ncbi:3',5'-cyclic nucleotide phosphodiesterase, putative [Plasmodium malariae]|uniref:Phosphodiesterase n=1 Tax=Plasmodium malariae TaxID=5858 RepID=A0A1D3TEF9_PLAMA|nr:3',5'-cyclic nucleotide phosphodiesterase, putative [Plasmodium malariae]SCP03328.1 3',5'-cyclic nucleotide phosphodiesterase, putative [Plasmodium malariae]
MENLEYLEENNENSNFSDDKNEEGNENSNSSFSDDKNTNSGTNMHKTLVTKKSFLQNVLAHSKSNSSEVDSEQLDHIKEKESKLKDLSRNDSICKNVVKKKNSNLKNLSDNNNNIYKELKIKTNELSRQDNNTSEEDKLSLTNNFLDTYNDKEICNNSNNNKNYLKKDDSSINWSTSNINTDSNSDFSKVEVKILENKKEEIERKGIGENSENLSNTKNKNGPEYNQILNDIKQKKLKEINIDDIIGKEKNESAPLKSKRSISFMKNVEDNNLKNIKIERNKENPLIMNKFKRNSTYDNNEKKFSNLRNNANRYASANTSFVANASTNTNMFFHSPSGSYGNIKLSGGNVMIKNERIFGINKNLKKVFEQFFYEIWKQNIIINKEFYTSNNKNGLNPYKSNFSESCLNQSNEKELVTRIPLKFKDETLETLYVLNLNNWISSRMIIIGIIMLILCFFIWFLFTWSFKSNAWQKDSYVVLLFHALMVLNTIILIFFIIVGSSELSKYAELMSYILFGVMVSMWGLWNIGISLTLNENITSKAIPSLSSAAETIYALTFFCGLLPLVIMDVLIPSRTKYNWFIHLIFIVLNSTSIILVCTANPAFMPAVYVIFRVIEYIMLCVLLYMGCYTSELQIRYVFYNLLITGYKLDKVESDMNKNNKSNKEKVSTAIEDLILMIKECTKVILEIESENDVNFNVLSKTSYCTNILEQCLSTLTKTDNLYNIDYGAFDKLENKKFIEAYVSKTKSNYLADQNDRVDFKLNKSFSNNDCICVDKVDIDKKEIKKFLKEIDIPHVTNMIQLIDNKILSQWDFSCLSYFEKSNYPFFDINLSLMFTIEHDIPINSIINFLSFVEKQYNNVPYHNTIHATMVTQKFFCLSKKLGIYDHMEYKIKLVMFISGICHDIGHPGYNNLFFVNSLHPLSIIYNDISVLENYHASITFKILQLNQCNLLKSFSEKDFRLIRLCIIELILSTDMKHHFEIISKFRIRRENEDFDYIKNNDDLLVLIKMIIKSADISHGSVKWNEHYKWCQRVLCEFYSQGDEEIKNKMPLSPLCDRTKHNEVCQSQITFLKFVVMPLFEELTYINDNKFIRNFCLKRLHSNCLMWDKFMKEGKVIKVYDSSNENKRDKMKKRMDKRKKSYIDLTLFFIKSISD